MNSNNVMIVMPNGRPQPSQALNAAKSSQPRSPGTIVDSRLHVKHDLGQADLRNAEFFVEPGYRAHFGSQLLLYEHVIIPTNDFGIVPALFNWMGQMQFEAALDSGAVSFLHRKGLLGYIGNGNGISSFTVTPGPQKEFRWWQKALFGDLSEAAELQLMYRVPSLTRNQRNSILQRIIKHSRPIEYDNEFFLKNIADESYKDLRDTPELGEYILQLAVSAGHRPGEPVNLRWIPGVNPNQVQLAGDQNVLNAADLAVRVAETNMEIVLAYLPAALIFMFLVEQNVSSGINYLGLELPRRLWTALHASWNLTESQTFVWRWNRGPLP